MKTTAPHTMTIAFTGGGTGGHIYPGLAVAAELQKQLPSIRIIWLGSSSGMDRNIVEEAGLEFFGIPSGKLRRYFSLKNFTDLFKILAGFFAAKKILKQQKAHILFSKGGFVSVPPCAAASALKLSVFTHESDFSPGLATKLNARFVLRTGGKIFTAYEDTIRFFKEKYRPCVVCTGQPVRADFRTADPVKGREFLGVAGDARILLVLGGSQGSKEINELILSSLPELTKYYTVVHQTGSNSLFPVPCSLSYKPYPYIKEELPNIMAASEIIMGRSGAGIWEWAVCGKPMILVPLKGSGTRGDQVENARFFEEAGAAIVLNEANAPHTKSAYLTAQNLTSAVELLYNNAERRKNMAESSLRTGRLDAAWLVAGYIKAKLESIMNEH